jgi:hypothetical protein
VRHAYKGVPKLNARHPRRSSEENKIKCFTKETKRLQKSPMLSVSQSTALPKDGSSNFFEIGVLGAFNQVQREHRKHSVHLATLRAQGKFVYLRFLLDIRHSMVPTVKKNAQSKKDELGPCWTHWVGKAVEKLVSRLVLSFDSYV